MMSSNWSYGTQHVRRVTARRAQVTGAAGQEETKRKARSAKLSQGVTDRAVVAHFQIHSGVKMKETKLFDAPGQPVRFANRIWHRGACKYLYAEDYGVKAFPIGKTKRK